MRHEFQAWLSKMAMNGIADPLWLLVIGTCLAVYVTYFLFKQLIFTTRVRRRYHDIPSLQRHWFWGNLKDLNKYFDPSSPKHPDYGIEKIWKELGKPEAFLLDVAPVDHPMVVITDPAIAEQVTQPSLINKYSTLKGATTAHLDILIGKESILTAQGEEWKSLRRKFSKGYSPSHLYTLTPLMVSKVRIFIDRLKRTAQCGETVSLKEYVKDFATDVITTIAIAKDFGSQYIPDGQGPKGRFGYLTVSRKLPGLVYRAGQGLDLRYLLDITRPIKSMIYQYIQNSVLDNLIREKLKADRQRTDKGSPRAIVQLALEGIQTTAKEIANARSQIKSFIFAGQDATATTIQWMCWEMGRAVVSPESARILRKLRAEHDQVFGSIHSSVLAFLADPGKAEQILGDKLPYTTAFINEILRVHPPASTVRSSTFEPKHEMPLTLNIEGKPTRVDGLRLYVIHSLIHRHPKFWGPDAEQFRPDRWLDEAYMRSIPTGAWRAFERGPRNCLGQEFAMIELKIVLCAIARIFRFEKIGYTGRNGEPEIYNIHEVTAVPCDGMMMKVHLEHPSEKEYDDFSRSNVVEDESHNDPLRVG